MKCACWLYLKDHISQVTFFYEDFLTPCPLKLEKKTSSNDACAIITAFSWAQLCVGLHLKIRVCLRLPPSRLSICFLHKVNKRYFEILVHSGVASQKRKAGIYFKKWKWFGGKRHISSLVPSLCPENRSRTWSGVVRRALGRGRAFALPMILPWLRGRFTLPRSRMRTGKAFLTLGTIKPYVLCAQQLWTKLSGDFGESFPSGCWSESQKGKMQFLQFGLGLDGWTHALTLMKHDCPRTLTDATQINPSMWL